ncbi:MAG: sugar ABC transporter permease [Oscillospiraceae bacterium]|nr:sugar ABC transporter permease [Oscillospiraceae bacterium]
MEKSDKPARLKRVSYSRYGYFFIAPFFIVYLLFQFWPLLSTFYYSFFEYTTRNLKTTVNFCGIQNYRNILGLTEGERAYFLQYLGNTLVIWLCNFVPQILLALLMAAWLTDERYRLPGRGLTKIMVYMPNIITAASISVLFGAMFSQYGPVTAQLRNWGWINSAYDFMRSKIGTRGLISFILFWMWYGNTTLLLISGMLGINPDLYEAADLDGAGGWHKFTRITLPLLKPILLYVLVTSSIGGLQMYDIPALFNVDITGALIGLPDDKTTTIAMYIMRLYKSDTGRAAAVCVMLFIITLAISMIFFASLRDREDVPKRRNAKGGARK